MSRGADHICTRRWRRKKTSTDGAKKGSPQGGELQSSWWHWDFERQAKVFGLDAAGNEDWGRYSPIYALGRWLWNSEEGLEKAEENL